MRLNKDKFYSLQGMVLAECFHLGEPLGVPSR